MRTCRIFWALTQEGQNWHEPLHAPRSVVWKMKWYHTHDECESLFIALSFILIFVKIFTRVPDDV